MKNNHHLNLSKEDPNYVLLDKISKLLVFTIVVSLLDIVQQF